MKFATLVHPIDIERRQGGQDAYNQPIDDWAKINCAPIMASVRPLAGREYFAAQQVQASVSHEVRLRWMPDVLPSDRIRYGERVFDIKSVLNIDEANRELVIMCTEHLPQ
jgi:SPP1 family predicted phage head-tail adaptor